MSAQSASTGATFFFLYPADSSAMVRPLTTTRFAVTEFYEGNHPFELSPREGSTERLVILLISARGETGEGKWARLHSS